MPRSDSRAAVYDAVLASAQQQNPWTHQKGQSATYKPDYGLLEDMLSVAVAAGAGENTQSGVFPKGIDLWLSHELRRAGFLDAEVWPRADQPRVLPRDVALLIDSLPKNPPGWPRQTNKGEPLNLQEEIRRRAAEAAAVTPNDAVVLGRAYDKQVDVVISRWDRGPEVLISTKAQGASFAKNLPNRFEEAVGDAANLTSRYPLAAVGFFFVQRATILTTEPETWERTKDMMRKLRSDVPGLGYTATGLCLVDWDDTVAPADRRVEVMTEPVPEDLQPDVFLAGIIERVLAVTPVAHHVAVRERYEGRALPIPITDPLGEGLAPEDADLFSTDIER
ncbi:hypothetical protein [Kribbella sp. NPDC055071]